MRSRPRGYDEIKKLATEYGMPYQDLLVLAPQNDPFYCGMPAQIRAAEWFAQIWRDCGQIEGVHLRRIHYAALSIGALLPDGSPYLNTKKCWTYLENASKSARTLGLVPANEFVDRRNPDPHLYAPAPSPRAEVGLYDYERDIDGDLMLPTPIRIPTLSTHLHGANFALPTKRVSGYDYHADDQPFHVEVWIEKSTMNDVLIPLCSSLGVNLQTGIGFQSISNVAGRDGLLSRISRHQKPARIVYVSDFDPAGTKMPPAVARQIEFHWRDSTEIKLDHIALTRGQVDRLGLPRIPIKEHERRKDNFEDAHGEGAVELDALEALHPGELARIVTEAVAPYRDDTLERRLDAAEVDAQDFLDVQWHEHTEDLRDEADMLAGDFEPISAKYQAKLDALRAEYVAETRPLQDRATALWQAISERSGTFDPYLPARPDPECDLPCEDRWLYDSNRSYLDQLAAYNGDHP